MFIYSKMINNYPFIHLYQIEEISFLLTEILNVFKYY